MFFFTLVDPAAPCLEDRATDETWKTVNRLEFARNAVRALAELHQQRRLAFPGRPSWVTDAVGLERPTYGKAGTADEPIVHRNLTPRTILVKHDNSPILTGFERMRIPAETSVASSSLPTGSDLAAVAPEAQSQGFAAADCRSDVYSLCVCLTCLFEGREDDLSRRAVEVLSRGLAEGPEQRVTLQELDDVLSGLLGDSVPPPPPPPARFWTEEQVVRFRERDYRIVARLGSGGVGTTFKVVEIDRSIREEFGTYVAQVPHEGETGQRVLKPL